MGTFKYLNLQTVCDVMHYKLTGHTINKWTQFYVPNEDGYKQEIQEFLNKNFVKLSKKQKETKLASYGKKEDFIKNKTPPKKNRLGLIFFSQNQKSKGITITFERHDKKSEAIVSKYMKKRFKNKLKIRIKLYYLLSLPKGVTLNKRKICKEEVHEDYDLLHYKSPILTKTIEVDKETFKVAIQFFKNGVKFLGYPSMEAIEHECKHLHLFIDNYKIRGNSHD